MQSLTITVAAAQCCSARSSYRLTLGQAQYSCTRSDLRSAFAMVQRQRCGLALNCAAVIESIDGSLSYWAVQHPQRNRFS
jgi:hypothetical protein